jgi:hypothetical protein
MGWEPVLYKGKWFDLDNQIISWLQKFMELYLTAKKHPKWFCEVLADLHGNFHVPHGKYFFDEDIIGDDKERLMYCVEMLNLTIKKMQSISKRDFFEFIKEDIKDSWCDINNNFYNDEWLNDNENYKKYYVESLLKLRSMMENR